MFFVSKNIVQEMTVINKGNLRISQLDFEKCFS